MAKNKKNGRKHGCHSKTKTEACLENVTSDVVSYRTEKSAELGRYLVSSRSLKPGEIILEDFPLVAGPCQESKPLCLGCYRSISLSDRSSYHRCPSCQWPLCSEDCPGFHIQHGHSTHECNLLSLSKSAQFVSEASYYAITPLRCLALQTADPPSWKIIKEMESHSDIRRTVGDLWTSNQRLVVARIRDSWGLTQFSEVDIHMVCGVLEVNSFEVGLSGPQSLRAIYPRAFLFAHDCIPNTVHSDCENFRMVVRASHNVPADTMLTVSYAYTLQSTLKRRKHLLSTKFFSCQCRRCGDATEVGTYCGALRCPLCKGLVLSEEPLNNNADWKCVSCRKHVLPADEMMMLLDRLSDELDSIDGNNIEAYERFLTKNSSVLHDNHYHCLSALYSLSQLYGKTTGFLINDLADDQLERKIDICRQLLDVFSVLEPGRSRQRGILLYELQAPLMVQVGRKSETQQIPRKELKMKLREICKYLEESHTILQVENPSSAEYSVSEAAKEALTNLTQS